MFNAQVDFAYLKKRLVPHFMRMPKLLAFLSAICKPLFTVNTKLRDFVDDIEYTLLITNQKIYLEKLLNECFDPAENRIFIENLKPNKFNYLYNFAESEDTLILRNFSETGFNPVYLLNSSELNDIYDYVIKYPDSLTLNEAAVREKVDKYNPSSRVYFLEQFSTSIVVNNPIYQNTGI